jgi:3'-phosphoadenosine 5'-phosphosulfate (PAPS) 3'-phosphatase
MEVALATACEAAGAVRRLYDAATAATYDKADGSPVTDADLESDRIIRARLTSAFPGDALLTEEGKDDLARLQNERVWIADPIDGTKQFIQRTGEFDVLIALVVGDRPVLGVAVQPSTGMYVAAVEGQGAIVGRGGETTPLRLQPVADGVAPRLRTSIWLNGEVLADTLGRLAERIGAAPPVLSPLGIVPRAFVPPAHAADALIGPPAGARQTLAWEWDIAVADIVINEAGGLMSDVRGNAFRYNKPEPRNIGGILLSVDPRTHERIVRELGSLLDA